jgi:hypothetical protein
MSKKRERDKFAKILFYLKITIFYLAKTKYQINHSNCEQKDKIFFFSFDDLQFLKKKKIFSRVA